MAIKSRSMKPAPVIQVAIPGRAAFRMSFNSPEGKPIDWRHGLKLASMAAAGDDLREVRPYSGLIWCDQPLDDGSRYIVEHNCKAYDDSGDLAAEVAYRCQYRLPADADVTITHPSIVPFVVTDREYLQAVKPRAVPASKILDRVRDEIRNATDAEAALARLAALVGLDMVPA